MLSTHAVTVLPNLISLYDKGYLELILGDQMTPGLPVQHENGSNNALHKK